MAAEQIPQVPVSPAEVPSEYHEIMDEAQRIHAGLPEPSRDHAAQTRIGQIENRPDGGESVGDEFCIWAAKVLLKHENVAPQDLRDIAHRGIVRDATLTSQQAGFLGMRYQETRTSNDTVVNGWVLDEVYLDRKGKRLEPDENGDYPVDENGDSEVHTIQRVVLAADGRRFRTIEQMPPTKKDRQDESDEPLIVPGPSMAMGAKITKDKDGAITDIGHSKITPSAITIARLMIRNGLLEADPREAAAAQPNTARQDQADLRQRLAEAQLAAIQAQHEREEQLHTAQLEATAAQTKSAQETAVHAKRQADAAERQAALMEQLLRRAAAAGSEATSQDTKTRPEPESERPNNEPPRQLARITEEASVHEPANTQNSGQSDNPGDPIDATFKDEPA